jgi:hypothetical protein
MRPQLLDTRENRPMLPHDREEPPPDEAVFECIDERDQPDRASRTHRGVQASARSTLNSASSSLPGTARAPAQDSTPTSTTSASPPTASVPGRRRAQRRSPENHQPADRVDDPTRQRERAHRTLPWRSRHPRSPPRRPPTRRSTHPRARPAAPGCRVRPRRHHRHPIQRRRPTASANPSRTRQHTRLTTNPRVEPPHSRRTPLSSR